MRYLPCGLFAGRDSLWKFNFSILFYDDILSPVKHGGGGEKWNRRLPTVQTIHRCVHWSLCTLTKQTPWNVNMCEKWCATRSWRAYTTFSYLTGRSDSMPVDMVIINLRISFLCISQIWMICQAGNKLSAKSLSQRVSKHQTYKW